MTGTGGVLVVDDTTLDKPYARKMDLVTWHWSGKHRCVVRGINLITLLWTDEKRRVQCDLGIYDAPLTGLTKNDRFQEMLTKTKQRSMNPLYVLFDTWYCSTTNLNLVTRLDWHFLTRLKSNRIVRADGRNIPVSDAPIPRHGRTVYLKQYGTIKVFRTVSKNGDEEYWVTSNLSMKESKRENLGKQGRSIEVYHRGIKQCCGVERSHVRKAGSIVSHILLSVRAFLRLEAYRIETGTSWYEAKNAIIRYAIRSYLSSPFCDLGLTA